MEDKTIDERYVTDKYNKGEYGSDWARKMAVRFNRIIKDGVEQHLAEGVPPVTTLGEFLVILEIRIKELENVKKE